MKRSSNHLRYALNLGLSLGLIYSGSSMAVDYLEEQDFENFDVDALTDTDTREANSKFAIPPVFEDNLTIGANSGGLFEITDAASWSGSKSLRYNYSGNNGICNICGAKAVRHSDTLGITNAQYFVDKDGQDLTTLEDPTTNPLKNDGPRAEINKFVYNNSNGFSKWRITGITNEDATRDRLNLELVTPPLDGSTPGFNTNDQVRITRRCNYDGTVGGQVDRKSDCDAGITWFGRDSHQIARPVTDRSSFFRRYYLRQDVSSPVVHTKLRYVQLGRDTGGGNFTYNTLVMYAEATESTGLGEIRPVLAGLHRMHPAALDGGTNPIDTILKAGQQLPELIFERGQWYYIEEEIKPESADRADDGYYRLWITKAGMEPTVDCDPTQTYYKFEGLSIPPLSWSSMWGNNQHFDYSIGSWFIDDMEIANTCNGKVAQGVNTSDAVKPPAAP